jgi:hypothetical protein
MKEKIRQLDLKNLKKYGFCLNLNNKIVELDLKTQKELFLSKETLKSITNNKELKDAVRDFNAYNKYCIQT